VGAEMKKLFALITFVCCLSAEAATWIPVNGVGDRKSAVDITSLVYTDNTMTVRSAWIKMFRPQNQIILARIFVHCPTRMYASGQYNTFSADGRLLASTDSTLTPWEYSAPDSVIEMWGNIICTTPINNR
jgi:hypothetical protein